MPRNFERRYEIMFPVDDRRARGFVLRALRNQLRDDVNTYELRHDGAEVPCWGGRDDCQRLPLSARGAPEHLDPLPPAATGADFAVAANS